MTLLRTTVYSQALRWGALLFVAVGYSMLSYVAAASTGPSVLNALVAITPMLCIACVMAWRSSQRWRMLLLCLVLCAALYAVRGWLLLHYHWVFLLEHAGMYALLCSAFGSTLRAGETPMVTRFARIVHGELSPLLMAYTRGATWAWCIYFGSIAVLSLLLFWLVPVAVWSAFANLLSGLLLVLMFFGEYAARCWVLPVADRAGPVQAFRAYQQASSRAAVR